MVLGRSAALGAALVTVLTLTGCGGDDDGSEGSADGSATATVTVTATPTPTPEPTVSETIADPPTPEPTPEPAPTGPPTTYDEALAHIEAARDVTDGGARELAEFTTPSGNIYCALNLASTAAGCELLEGAVPDPAYCGDAPSQQVGRIELRGGAAVPVCNTDTIVRPGAPTLGYGEAAYTRDTACVSEEIGVTCVSRAGAAGFFLHRGEYVLFDR